MDAYRNEAVGLPRFKHEMGQLKVRRGALERQLQRLQGEHQERERLADTLVRLEEFCQRVSQGLRLLTFEEKQRLLRLLVDRIVVDGERMRIEGIIPLHGRAPEDVFRPTRPGDW